MLGNRQEEIVHHVTNLWTLVNKTRSYIRENRKDIGTLHQQVRDVRLALRSSLLWTVLKMYLSSAYIKYACLIEETLKKKY